MKRAFTRLAQGCATAAGSLWAFIGALGLVLAWGLMGLLIGFSDSWQLVINTSTTILTFLMVFLIQNAQNRDTAAIMLKLDELIKATGGARNTVINAEQLTDEELNARIAELQTLAGGRHE